MRLFIAVNPAPELALRLDRLTGQLRAASSRGVFVGRENLHLTLVFLGETAQVRDAEKALDNLSCEPFEIEVCGTGRFKRSGVVWGGVIHSESLMQLQQAVFKNAQNAGFELENRTYHPHITLVREARVKGDYRLPEVRRNWMAIGRVCLMKSERQDGKLVYTEVKGVKLL